jgi:cyclic pyranopterin phosphate synthase
MGSVSFRSADPFDVFLTCFAINPLRYSFFRCFMSDHSSALSHLDDKGAARMVDVGAKPATARRAVAEGSITMRSETLRAIADGTVPKGEVLNTARIAGIMGAKRCGDLIPLCHPLPIESVEVDFDIPELEPADEGPIKLYVKAAASITAKTGIEMEALAAVSMAALTIYDMCKAIDKTMVIGDIRVVSKTGGTKAMGLQAP